MASGAWRWRPSWWSWPILLSGHLLHRMVDRAFSETDLREMLEVTTGIRPGVTGERWVAECVWRGDHWNVVLEPDPSIARIVVVTAYRV